MNALVARRVSENLYHAFLYAQFTEEPVVGTYRLCDCGCGEKLAEGTYAIVVRVLYFGIEFPSFYCSFYFFSRACRLVKAEDFFMRSRPQQTVSAAW